MSNSEIWKPSFVDGYEVSNQYRVRRSSDMKIMSPDKRNPKRIRLHVKGKSTFFEISKLVEPVFNPIPGLR